MGQEISMGRPFRATPSLARLIQRNGCQATLSPGHAARLLITFDCAREFHEVLDVYMVRRQDSDRRLKLPATSRVLSGSMKTFLFLFLAIVAFVVGLVCGAWAETPVIVELFTSEGCSSCPPADALLVDLSRRSSPSGAKLILLGEHVDYWNYIGWTDRFSSASFSERQSTYANHFHLGSVYTPQMVIDGHLQTVGSGTAEVYRDISKAAVEPKPAQVTLRWEPQQKLNIAVQTPASARSKVLLAITEDGLSTSVGGGENGGRTLQHAAVVRQLRELGPANNGQFEASVDLAPHPDWNQSKLKVAVLVQDAGSGRIQGAASLDYVSK